MLFYFNVCVDLHMLVDLLGSSYPSFDSPTNSPSNGSSSFVKVITFSRGCFYSGVDLQDLRNLQLARSWLNVDQMNVC